jgi:hypothetical protein
MKDLSWVDNDDQVNILLGGKMGHVLCVEQNNQLKKKMNPCTQKQHDLPLVQWTLNHIEWELNSTQTYSY